MATPMWIRKLLQMRGIPFSELHHAESFTSQQVARQEHEGPLVQTVERETGHHGHQHHQVGSLRTHTRGLSRIGAFSREKFFGLPGQGPLCYAMHPVAAGCRGPIDRTPGTTAVPIHRFDSHA